MNKKTEDKIINKDKIVYECIKCGYRIIDTDRPDECERCFNKNTLVINKNLIVCK
jgi:rubrerythrin